MMSWTQREGGREGEWCGKGEGGGGKEAGSGWGRVGVRWGVRGVWDIRGERRREGRKGR
jgi:hypothetical protein